MQSAAVMYTHTHIATITFSNNTKEYKGRADSVRSWTEANGRTSTKKKEEYSVYERENGNNSSKRSIERKGEKEEIM